MLSLQEGQVVDGQYELLRLIDTGGFTEVWEAKYLVAGNTVALKIYPKLDEEGIRSIEAEYKRLFELQHSNLLNVLHFGRYNGYPYLVMRLYAGGNASRKIGSCTEPDIVKCMAQIGGVLKYLHANDFVHQDVKPNNFLLDQYGNYFLADLGLSLKLRNTIRMQTRTVDNMDAASIQTGVTPPPYRAPELYDRQRSYKDPVKATDIWALGASFYEMITGDPPFGDLGGLMQINDPVVRDLPSAYSRELDKIIKSCLEKDPARRPTAAELERRALYYLENGGWEKKAPAPRKTNPVLIVIVTLALMAAGVYIVKQVLQPKKPDFALNMDTAVTKQTDTTLIHPIRQVKNDPPVTKDSVTDPPRTNPTGRDKTNPTDRDKELFVKKTDPVTPSDARVIDHPSVTSSPQSECSPRIARVSLNDRYCQVTFYFSNCTHSITLYSPGNEHSFYIRSGDKTYDMTSITTSGDDVKVPSGGLYVTATFQPLDRSTSMIDVMEGKNQLERGTIFFNFKGIRLQ